MLDDNLLLTQQTDIDYGNLSENPTPEEFFLLSRIAGEMTVAQICMQSGLGRDKALRGLERLIAFGLLRRADGQPMAAAALASSAAAVPEAPRQQAATKSAPAAEFAGFPADYPSFQIDPALLADAESIDPERVKAVVFVHAHLDAVDHYTLLGVPADADGRTIRKAYFKMSKRFHPDRYFRKEVGELRAMVEAIFKRVNLANQTLSNADRRSAYDRELEQSSAASESEATAVSAGKDPRKREMAVQLLLKRAKKREGQGDLVGAADELRKAVAIQRDRVMMVEIANLLLRANRRLSEAATFTRAALREEPEDVEAMVLLAHIYEKNGALVEAMEVMERALQLDPQDPSVTVHAERIRGQLESQGV